MVYCIECHFFPWLFWHMQKRNVALDCIHYQLKLWTCVCGLNKPSGSMFIPFNGLYRKDQIHGKLREKDTGKIQHSLSVENVVYYRRGKSDIFKLTIIWTVMCLNDEIVCKNGKQIHQGQCAWLIMSQIINAWFPQDKVNMQLK